MTTKSDNYIRGFLAGISYVLRTSGKGGLKVAELPYTWREMEAAEVPEQHVRRLHKFLCEP